MKTYYKMPPSYNHGPGSITTKQFLRELDRIVTHFEGVDNTAYYFEVTPSFLRSVISTAELPGKKILSKMLYKADKTINYRYLPIEGES